MMNQKIYLVLWVWFVVLFSVSACMIIYRVLTCMLPLFQRIEIQGYLKSTDDFAVQRLIIDFDHIGNYFVLTQIGRNATPYTFRKFLDEVVDRSDETKKKDKENDIMHFKEKLLKPKNALKKSQLTKNCV